MSEPRDGDLLTLDVKQPHVSAACPCGGLQPSKTKRRHRLALEEPMPKEDPKFADYDSHRAKCLAAQIDSRLCGPRPAIIAKCGSGRHVYSEGFLWHGFISCWTLANDFGLTAEEVGALPVTKILCKCSELPS